MSRRTLPWWRRALQRMGRSLATFGSVLAAGATETGFGAARWTRLFADWTIWRRSADQEIAGDLGALRARARQQALNNPYVRRFLSQVATNVAGPHGVRLKAKVETRDGSPDLETNRAVETAFTAWSRVGGCTVDGRHSRAGLERLLCQAVALDGELFVRLVEGFPNRFGFALQLLDADLCDETYDRAPAEGVNEIRMGVEIDRWGRPVAYHCFTSHPAEVGQRRERRAIPASEIIHLYVPARPGQTRGVPWTHAVLGALKHLDGYQEAELVAARTAAAKGGFFTSSDGEAALPTDEAERLQLQAEPGLFEQLPPGMQFQAWDPTHPTQAYGAYVTAVLRSIAVGLDVSHHNLAGDLSGVNYSSARVGELDERDHWRALQRWLIEQFHERVYPVWLKWALTTRQLAVPLTDIDRLQMVQWMPRGWAWVDPQNELAAIETALRLQLTSRTQVAAQQGYDLEEVYADLAAEQALAAEYGLATPAAVAPGAAAAGNADDMGEMDAMGEDEEDEPARGNGNGRHVAPPPRLAPGRFDR